MRKFYFSVLALALSCTIMAAETYKAPNGFETICTLDENCAVSESTLVAFGNNDHFVYKTLEGNFLCSPRTFDVPANQTVVNSHCSILSPTSTSSSALSKSESASSPSAQNTPVIDSGFYALISRSSGKALAVIHGSQEDGAKVVQQNFEQNDHQIWQVKLLDSGYYSITALHSNKSLENLDWDSRDGAHVHQLPWINSWNQHWMIQPTDDGYVKVLSRTNGQALDVYEMNNKNQGNVVLWTYWGGSNQQWRFVSVDVKH